MKYFLILIFVAISLFGKNANDRQLEYSSNLFYNGGAEFGTSGWVTAGAAGSTKTWETGTNALFGYGAIGIDFTTSGQYIETTPVTVPNGLIGQPCKSSVYLKGWSSGQNVSIYDGTSGTISESRTFTTSETNPSQINFQFNCPAQGQIKFRLTSFGNDNKEYIDDLFIGKNLNPIVSLKYNSSSSAVTAGSDGIVVYSTKEFDTHSAYNNSTGIFTAPLSGIYYINARLAISATYAAGNASRLHIYKNGVLYTEHYQSSIYVGATTEYVQINTTVNLLKGDTLAAYARSSGAGPSIASSATRNDISIIRIGD